MSDAVATALLAALIWKLTDFLKHVTNRDVSAITTQLVAWAAGFVAVVLFAHSSVAGYTAVNGVNFAHASWVDQLLIGLTVGSAGSGLYDFKRAIDNSDSAATPRLIPSASFTTPVSGKAVSAPAARGRAAGRPQRTSGATVLELLALVLLIVGVILLIIAGADGSQHIGAYVPGIVCTAVGLVMVAVDRSGVSF